MNRRELFQSVAGAAAASGADVHASTIEADAKPALALIECDRAISNDFAERLMSNLDKGLKGTPFEGLKVIVLGDGLKLTLLDANGRPLNRRLEDEPLA